MKTKVAQVSEKMETLEKGSVESSKWDCCTRSCGPLWFVWVKSWKSWKWTWLGLEYSVQINEFPTNAL